ncbi:protein of unknown function (plasmid) [Cupriavidus taiwanensis]|uniref:Uncharacterized protein n=1 Tax=Cupriavidus taiwanensis TaxID=164546 RepID=A0A375ILI5_9BURK|nr:protein of unknown function [Cupriavidus taiwanensis]
MLHHVLPVNAGQAEKTMHTGLPDCTLKPVGLSLPVA